MKKILIIGLFSLCFINLAFAGTGFHALERATNSLKETVNSIKEAIPKNFDSVNIFGPFGYTHIKW